MHAKLNQAYSISITIFAVIPAVWPFSVSVLKRGAPPAPAPAPEAANLQG